MTNSKPTKNKDVKNTSTVKKNKKNINKVKVSSSNSGSVNEMRDCLIRPLDVLNDR